MHGRSINHLVVIENGQLTSYSLDDKLVWELGRPSKGNMPDICLHSSTVSRRHGKFQNMDGIWFYVDYGGKNGTVYNDRRIRSGIHGRIKPIILNNGDFFVFGGGEKTIINYKTVWALYMQKDFGDRWRVSETKGWDKISFADGNDVISMEKPAEGTVVEKTSGIAIYMGDITYLAGSMAVYGN